MLIRYCLLLGLLGSLLIAAACERRSAEPAAPVPVRTSQVARLSDADGLNYSAEVVPAAQVTVSFRTDGYVIALGQVDDGSGGTRALQPGDPVAAGTELARIDERQYQDTVQQAKAGLASAEAALRKGQLDYRRANALYRQQSITQADYDSAVEEYTSSQAAVDNARAQLDQAELKLRDTRLLAPFSGVIIRRDVEIGTLAHSGSAGFELADLSRVHVVFGVPDVILDTVSLGSTLTINSAALPEQHFSGKVTEIDPSADPRTRIFSVTIEVDNSAGLLKPGMIAALVLDRTVVIDQVLVVPIPAVVEDPASGAFSVYRIIEADDGAQRVQRQTIAVGQVLGDRIVVTAGLSAEDSVVSLGAGQLSDGQAVAVLP